MSSVAQILCNEICDKSLTKPPKQNSRVSFKNQTSHSRNYYNDRPTRSVVIEKKRVINKVVPSDISSNSRIINKHKSKEIILKKKLIDTGLNTIITGPLRCDNNCVTVLQKRDAKRSVECHCKGMKCKMSAKEIQTFNFRKFLQLDKACTHCTDTVNCGTQFFERLSSRSRGPMNVRTIFGPQNEVFTQTTNLDNTSKDIEKNETSDSACRSNFYKYMGARRWALSRYPTRGPDF